MQVEEIHAVGEDAMARVDIDSEVDTKYKRNYSRVAWKIYKLPFPFTVHCWDNCAEER